jgi:hypothetical protein
MTLRVTGLSAAARLIRHTAVILPIPLAASPLTLFLNGKLSIFMPIPDQSLIVDEEKNHGTIGIRSRLQQPQTLERG